MDKKKITTPLKIVGIILIIAGVILFIVAASMYVPNMGDSGWFDSSSTQSSMYFGAAALCVLGIFLFIVSFATKSINTKLPTNVFNDGIFGEIKNKFKDKKCDYCGTICKPTETNCPNCSAALTNEKD